MTIDIIRLSLRIPENLYKRIKEQSEAQGISMNAFILNALWAVEATKKE